MQISLLLMQQIAQLFLILLMGYAVVKTGLLKASDSKVLSVVFVYLVMPCVVLNAFQIKDTPEIRTGLLYSMGIAVGMHVVFLLLNALFRRPLKLDAVEQVNIIYSNAAALVIPIVQALLGEHPYTREDPEVGMYRDGYYIGAGRENSGREEVMVLQFRDGEVIRVEFEDAG